MTTRILIGHVLDKLRELPAESVHCVVTSPPYYGLRDYGIEPQVWGGEAACSHEWGGEFRASQTGGGLALGGNQTGGDKNFQLGERSQGAFCLHCGCWRGSLGLEPALEFYLDHMVEVMREVRRVMRGDATCWLNIGDSYAGSWGAQSRGGPPSGSSTLRGNGHIGGGPKVKGLSAVQIAAHPRKGSHTGSICAAGLKPKDLMLIPARLAIRLQDDGWWVRSDIAWCKRSPMPESCTDRPTTAWEHVFLLTKGARYYYDADAVREDFADERMGADGGKAASQRNRGGRADGFTKPSGIDPSANGGRNMRNFWLLGPEPFPEAHFATFPSEIPRRAILAGTSEKGVCPLCAAPWARVTNTTQELLQATNNTTRHHEVHGWDAAKNPRTRRIDETIGWRPTCGCDMHPAIPATILDPFFGAGTTGLVADQLQRDCVGIELNSKYAKMAEQRILDGSSLFAAVAAE